MLIKSIFLVLLLVAAAGSAEDLLRLDRATLIHSEGNDGDSFRVACDKKEIIVRLYYADCPENKMTTGADAARLREQTRYFGLTDPSRTRHYGKLAGEFTRQALAQPFTVHTAFADARGRSEGGRVYAFVTTANGEDLAGLLIQNGLARSHGVRRELPDGTHRDEATAHLDDLETVALLKRTGIWQETDPDRLVELRATARLEDAELNALLDQNNTGTLNLNTATAEELKSISGIGDATAKRIIDLRPFRRPADLDRIPSLPSATRSNILERAIWP